LRPSILFVRLQELKYASILIKILNLVIISFKKNYKFSKIIANF